MKTAIVDTDEPITFSLDIYLHHILNFETFDSKTNRGDENSEFSFGFRLWNFPLITVSPTKYLEKYKQIQFYKGKSCIFQMTPNEILRSLKISPIFIYLFRCTNLGIELIGTSNITLEEMKLFLGDDDDDDDEDGVMRNVISGKFNFYSPKGYEVGVFDVDIRIRVINEKNVNEEGKTFRVMEDGRRKKKKGDGGYFGMKTQSYFLNSKIRRGELDGGGERKATVKVGMEKDDDDKEKKESEEKKMFVSSIDDMKGFPRGNEDLSALESLKLKNVFQLFRDQYSRTQDSKSLLKDIMTKNENEIAIIKKILNSQNLDMKTLRQLQGSSRNRVKRKKKRRKRRKKRGKPRRRYMDYDTYSGERYKERLWPYSKERQTYLHTSPQLYRKKFKNRGWNVRKSKSIFNTRPSKKELMNRRRHSALVTWVPTTTKNGELGIVIKEKEGRRRGGRRRRSRDGDFRLSAYSSTINKRRKSKGGKRKGNGNSTLSLNNSDISFKKVKIEKQPKVGRKKAKRGLSQEFPDDFDDEDEDIEENVVKDDDGGDDGEGINSNEIEKMFEEKMYKNFGDDIEEEDGEKNGFLD